MASEGPSINSKSDCFQQHIYLLQLFDLQYKPIHNHYITLCKLQSLHRNGVTGVCANLQMRNIFADLVW
jgi:hypothetical protein